MDGFKSTTDSDDSLHNTQRKCIVSIMVVDIVNSTALIADQDPEQTQQILDASFKQVSSIINANGGQVLQFTGDGAIAVFGWPNALDQHADFACMAALEVMSLGSEEKPGGVALNNQIAYRVGVQSGTAIVRRIEIDGGWRLDVIGSVVHMAASLQKAARPNSILVSEETLELCSLPFLSKRIESQTIAGARVLLDSPRVVAPRSRLTKLPKMVGRVEEMERLDTALSRIGELETSLCLEGPAGIGKSRLMREVWQRAQDQEINRVIVFCHPLKQNQPYFAIGDLLRRLVNGNEDVEFELFDAALRNLELDDDTTELILSVLRPGSRNPVKATQSAIQRAFIVAIRRCISQIATLICIEDTHLMDQESQITLSKWRVQDHSAPHFLLMSRRPVGEQVVAIQLADKVLEIGPIDDLSMREMIANYSENDETERIDLGAILSRADGVPFVLEQLLKSQERSSEGKFDPLPRTVESTIHAQINRLSAHARATLQLLSIFGNDYQTDIVSEALNLPILNTLEAIEELEVAGLIEQTSRGTLRFNHDILLDATLNTIHAKGRVKLHETVFNTLLNHRDGAGAEPLSLAHHAEQANKLETALDYLWMIALEAVRTSSSATLESIFYEALELMNRIGSASDDKFVDFVTLSFDSMQQIGKIDIIGELLAKAIDITRASGRPDKECLALTQLTTLRWYEGRNEEGKELGKRAMELADKIGALPLIYFAKFQLANTLYLSGDIHAGVQLQKELTGLLTGKLRTAKLGASIIPASMTNGFLCHMLTDLGRYEEAGAAGLEAVQIGRDCNQAYSIATGLMALGRLHLASGKNELAEGYLKEAFEHVKNEKLVTALAFVIGLLGTCLVRLGKPIDALKLIDEYLETADFHAGAKFTTILPHSARYEALRLLNRQQESEQSLEAAVAIATAVADPVHQARILSLPARVAGTLSTLTPIELSRYQVAVSIAEKIGSTLPHPIVRT